MSKLPHPSRFAPKNRQVAYSLNDLVLTGEVYRLVDNASAMLTNGWGPKPALAYLKRARTALDNAIKRLEDSCSKT